MRTRPQLIPWILTFAITGAAVVLRFVQLLLFTDSSTGRVTAAGAPLTYGLYALLLCAGVCCTVCALHQSHTAVAVAANGGSRRLTVVSYLVSVAFFFDFIYRCFLCYDLADGAVYLQWNDLVSEGLTALFALLSCSYYFVVGRSYGGGRVLSRPPRWNQTGGFPLVYRFPSAIPFALDSSAPAISWSMA